MVEQLPPHIGGYRNPNRGARANRPDLGAAALAYARKGIPVFPLRPGTKEPLYGSRGFYDATTDEARIHGWWSSLPDANIATPTGKASGRISLDIDTYKPGAWTPEDVARELGPLPDTLVIETGRGGLQYWFAHPEGEELPGSPENTLGPGVCVKSKGGYCLVPPSATEGPYKVLEKRPLAVAPEWLIEALRKPSSGSSKDGKTSPSTVSPIRVTADLNGPTIGAGNRNTDLYKIACSRRARGDDRGAILDHLRRVYEARCEKSPPMDAGELEKIAASAARHAPGNAAPEVSPETLGALDTIEADIMRREWPGMGGKSERDAAIAALRLARMHGRLIPAGVRVSVDVRTWALMSSVSKRAMLDNRKDGERVPGIVSRLKTRGVMRSDNEDRRGKDAGALVLLHPAPAKPARARLHHSTTSSISIEPGVACGATLRSPQGAPLTAPRLRWSRPVFDGPERVGTVSRLGKSKGEIIDHLEAAGGTLTVEDLAGAMGVSRVRDLRRRHLEPLEKADVVECFRDAVSLTADWLPALNERRELDGEIDDHRRDMARYEREREAYRNRHKRPADPAPTVEEMRERREGRAERRRRGIEAAIAKLFTDRPEYRTRRVGQIVCKLHDYLPADFPRGADGHPKDREVEAILDGEDVAA